MSLETVASELEQTVNAVIDSVHTLVSRMALLGVGSIVASIGASGQPGAQFDVPVNFIPTRQISALQFDIILPEGFSLVSATAGPVVTDAGKSVAANLVNKRVVVFGINVTPLGQGHLLTLKLAAQPTVAKRIYDTGMTGVTASDPTGVGVPISGMGSSIKIE